MIIGPFHPVRVSLLIAASFMVVPAGTGAAWHRLPPGSDAFGAAGQPVIRGVTIGPIESSLQPGRGYGTAHSAALLDELVRLGANWVSITPFGRLFRLDDTHVQMDFEAPYEENRRAVERVILQARARGLRVLLIPHLWIESGGWRGEIDPGSADGWRRYQESYRRFVLSWATDAERAGADAFSIGVECKSWSGRFVPYWTGLIAEVRARFGGLLTYSANWDEVEDVLFWDQLDLIGINAFYPLADEPGAADAAYRRGARSAMEGVRAVAEVLEMPVLLVEVGYTARPDAAVEPWLWPDGMAGVAVDEREQARALDAMIGAFADQPWFAGMFVWRYYANIDDISQEAIWGFSPHAKMAEDVLRRAFHGRFAADPVPYGPSFRPLVPPYPFTGLFAGPDFVDRPTAVP